MSANSQAVAPLFGGKRVSFKPGFDPRRNAGGMTKAEREWRRAIDEEHIPEANALAHRVRREAIKAYDAGDSLGGAKNAELYFKVLGLIKKPQTAEEEGAKLGAALSAFLADLKARRDATPVETHVEVKASGSESGK